MSGIIEPPETCLVSFHYFQNVDLNKIRNMRIVGDSGAYSARSQGITINVDQLGEWGVKWKHRLFWLATLDVSGDQKQTRRNFLHLLNEYGLETIPSIHLGDNPRELDWYADRGVDFLGIGGIAGGQANKEATLRWLVHAMRYARDNHPQMRFHGWGMTSLTTRALPFWSVDSTSWASSYRYGALVIRDPDTGATHRIKTNGKDIYRPAVSRTLVNHYGMKPQQVAISNAETRPDIIKLSALSTQVWANKNRKLHRPGITPPKWGILNPMGYSMTGPHTVLADSAVRNLQVLDELHD